MPLISSATGTVLDKILTHKVEEIAAREALRPLAEVQRAAASAIRRVR